MMVDVRVPCVCVWSVCVALFIPIYCARFHAVCELFHCTPLVSRVCRPPAGASNQVDLGSDNPEHTHARTSHHTRLLPIRRRV